MSRKFIQAVIKTAAVITLSAVWIGQCGLSILPSMVLAVTAMLTAKPIALRLVRCIEGRAVFLLLLLTTSQVFAGTAQAGTIDGYLEDMISIPNMIAGAVLALLCVGLINFVLANWMRAIRFGLAIIVLGLLLSMMGCTGEQEFSFALGHKPRQNTLRVIDREGQQIEIVINDDIPAQNLIALQTALSNSLVLDAEAIQQEAVKARQQQTVSIFWAVVWAIIFITISVCSTTIYVVYARRAGK